MKNVACNLIKKVPPCSLEAEKAVLGTLIMDSSRLPSVILQLSPKEFYWDKHRTIYESMITMDIGKQKVDLVTLADNLKGRVSADYLSSLMEGIYNKININAYIEDIKNKYILREIIRKAATVIDTAYKEDIGETAELLDELKSLPYGEKGKQTLSARIKDWVALTEAHFSLKEAKKDLNILKENDKNTFDQVIHNLKKDGIIEHALGKSEGWYKRIDNKLETLDWKTANGKEFPIELPFELSQLIYLLPKSILCIAGNFNAGKTAFCLETVRLNMGKMKINYFTSEMGKDKLRQRLKKFENVEFPDGWNFNAAYRSSNWSDCLKDFPDDLNIIDYLQIGESFWTVSDHIDGIFNRLGKGVAIVCLQKTLGRDLGRGGDFSAEKASLYLSIDPGKLKIIKAKEWRGMENPNGKFKRFKLVQGWDFRPDPDWITEEMEQALRESGKPQKRMLRT